MKILLIILLIFFQQPVKNYRLTTAIEDKQTRLVSGNLIIYENKRIRISEGEHVLFLTIQEKLLNYNGRDFYLLQDTIPMAYRGVLIITKTPADLKRETEEGFIFIEIRTAECLIELRYRYKMKVWP
jgi:hypothetical protein